MYAVFLRIFGFIAKWLLALTPAGVLKHIRVLFATMVGYLAMWALRGFIMVHPEVAYKILAKITKYYYTPPRVWAAFINEYMRQMTGSEISMEDLTRYGAAAGGASVMQNFGAAFLKPMLNLIMPDPPMTFEKGMNAANRFLGVNLTFQINAWLLHLVGDVVSLGKLKSLKDLPNAISWSYGIGWLSWLVMGTPFRLGISDPLEHGFNKVYTPALLTRTDAIRAWMAGWLSQKDMQDELLQAGFNPEKIALMVKLVEKELSDGDLKTLWQERVIDQTDIEDELAIRGYGKERRGYISLLLRKDRVLKWRNKVLDSVMDLFVLGEMTETECRGYLEVLKYEDEEKKLIIDFCILEKAKKTTPSDAEIKRALTQDRITYGEARGMLERRGWDARWADIILEWPKKE